MTTNNETDIMVVATVASDRDKEVVIPKYSSVNNPYTFSITRNVSFSAICEEDWSGGGK